MKNLAVEITKDKNNFYDKAKAVEQYFLKEPFVYETNDVAVPELDEDYVDQFLFETKKGYCDNFSTSMVVLLRSVGIPARWVKGYTPGQFVETTSEGLEVYEVTSNNAHSWVEVYFSGIGWVPLNRRSVFPIRRNLHINQMKINKIHPLPNKNKVSRLRKKVKNKSIRMMLSSQRNSLFRYHQLLLSPSVSSCL